MDLSLVDLSLLPICLILEIAGYCSFSDFFSLATKGEPVSAKQVWNLYLQWNRSQKKKDWMVLFLTPTNSAQMTKFVIENNHERIFVVGGSDVTHIPDNFLKNCSSLKEVTFVLPFVKTVGDHWIENCNSLTSPSFEGVSSLETIWETRLMNW